MNNRTFRIGLLKHAPQVLKLDENMNAFEKYVGKAREECVEMLVTCEGYLDGYYVNDKDFEREKFEAAAQDIEKSRYINRVREIAKENSMYIVFSFPMKVAGGVKNAALMVDDTGKDIGVYCKTHLVGTESERFVRGDDISVFDTKFGKIGMMICADRRWPETSRTLKLKGAEIIINPTFGRSDVKNEYMMMTRAYENELYVAFSHGRVSFVCNPFGDVEAKLVGSASGILVHDIDLSVKVNKTMMNKRQPDLYGVICDVK